MMNEILALFVAGWIMCANPTVIDNSPHYFFYFSGEEITATTWIKSSDLDRFAKGLSREPEGWGGAWDYLLSPAEMDILYLYSDNIIENCGANN